MDQLTKKTFTVSRGYTYTFYTHSPPTPTTKPTLLLCHGWPDSAELYAPVLPSLLNLGHPLVIPDCLGYAGTSKPTDYKEYSFKAMAHDLYELLDSEGVEKIVSLGHDFGSALAQRVYLYQPSRCAGVILLDVAYMPPSSTPFDLDTVNAMTEKAFGYPCFAYWDVFAADDGPELMLKNVETLFHAIHWDHPDAMRMFFATYGNTRKLLQTTGPEDYPLKPYAQAPGFKESFLERMRRDKFEAPQCWYKAFARGVHFDDEKGFSKDDLTIKVPCLYVSGSEDAVCRTDGMEAVKELVPDLTQHVVQANHWITFEKPEEVGGILAKWLKEKY